MPRSHRSPLWGLLLAVLVTGVAKATLYRAGDGVANYSAWDPTPSMACSDTAGILQSSSYDFTGQCHVAGVTCTYTYGSSTNTNCVVLANEYNSSGTIVQTQNRN